MTELVKAQFPKFIEGKFLKRKIIGLIAFFTILSVIGLAYAQTYSKITTFTGTSDQTTTYFSTSSSDLKIDWSYGSSKPMSAMLIISLYQQGNSKPADSFMTNMGQPSGTTYEHNLNAGNYYLHISATDTDGGYTVTVSQAALSPSTSAASATGSTPLPTVPEYPATALLISLAVIASLAIMLTKKRE